MHTLVSQAVDGVLLSWATLGQIGWHHVNCQPFKYVECVMGLLGFSASAGLNAQLRGNAGLFPPCAWLRHTLAAFRRDPQGGSQPKALLTPLPPFATESFREAYTNLTRARCPARVPDGCSKKYHHHGVGCNNATANATPEAESMAWSMGGESCSSVKPGTPHRLWTHELLSSCNLYSCANTVDQSSPVYRSPVQEVYSKSDGMQLVRSRMVVLRTGRGWARCRRGARLLPGRNEADDAPMQRHRHLPAGVADARGTDGRRCEAVSLVEAAHVPAAVAEGLTEIMDAVGRRVLARPRDLEAVEQMDAERTCGEGPLQVGVHRGVGPRVAHARGLHRRRMSQWADEDDVRGTSCGRGAEGSEGGEELVDVCEHHAEVRVGGRVPRERLHDDNARAREGREAAVLVVGHHQAQHLYVRVKGEGEAG
eukprot:2042136-Prymnesium_polylepis.1